MNKGKKSIIAGFFLAILTAGLVTVSAFMGTTKRNADDTIIYIDNDDTRDSVWQKTGLGWRGNMLNLVLPFKKVRTGRYDVGQDIPTLTLYRKLRNGQQDPIHLTIPTSRTIEKLAGTLSRKLMLDSLTLVNAFRDEEICRQAGYNTATLPAMFIPNTYEVYWDISLEGLVRRMQKENKAFWNTEREEKAKALNMSHEEICTLASIVD